MSNLVINDAESGKNIELFYDLLQLFEFRILVNEFFKEFLFGLGSHSIALSSGTGCRRISLRSCCLNPTIGTYLWYLCIGINKI